MACDSLYCAWLKVHYPYELYLTMLKLYDEKKNTDKISSIISEMKRYKDISLLAGKWGQDNRDWTADKNSHTISQSISSIRYMSKQVAADLYNLSQQEDAEMGVEFIPAKLNKAGKEEEKKLKAEVKEIQAKAEDLSELEVAQYNAKFAEKKDAIYSNPEYLEVAAAENHYREKFDCFTNVLRAIQMNTCLDTRNIKILIELGYFSAFGKSGKLMRIYNEFFEGENKLTKSIKSFNKRLDAIRELERSLPDIDLPIRDRLQSEQENIGLCLSVDPEARNNIYFVQDVDEKWGTTVTIYSVSNGKSGKIRFKKDDIRKKPVSVNQLITIDNGRRSPRYTYKGGVKTPIPGETEYWVTSYSIMKPA